MGESSVFVPIIVAVVSAMAGVLVTFTSGIFTRRDKHDDRTHDRQKSDSETAMAALRAVMEHQGKRIDGLTSRLTVVESDLADLQNKHQKLRERYGVAIGYVALLVTRLRLHADPTDPVLTPPDLIAKDLTRKDR